MTETALETSTLQRHFFLTGDAAEVLRATTERVDAIVQAAFAKYLAPTFPQGLAALAVGGYGRRELFPHSDIDLMLLENADPDKAGREAISRFLQAIWDSGLRLSHSVRSVKECLELHEANIELNISLLDRRFLTGDQSLWTDLEARMPKFLAAQRQPLTRHLCKMTRERHDKFHSTIFHLEPNIKETPGGLRDLHVIAWLAKLRGEASAAPTTPLDEARDMLFRLRCFLHYRANRDNNLLSFDSQEEYASNPLAYLPFSDVPGGTAAAVNSESPQGTDPDPAAAAAWMRQYFRGVRAISRETLRTLDTNEGEGGSLLAGFRDWRSRLSNSEFTISRERVLFRSPHAIATDPALVMRLFEFTGRHGLLPHRESERRIHEHWPALEAWVASGANLWPAVKEIFSTKHCATALRAMHETGVLSLIFPEFANIECAVIRDFNHRYTVDEHTIITIENLQDLATTTDPGRKRFASLLAELPDVVSLRLALLFHDTGKGGDGDAGHCITGAANARHGLTRIHAPEPVVEDAAFLVEFHLALSAAMNGRDLDDPATAQFLAHQIGTVERLRALTLLTMADIAAVHPTALSPWRIEQLWRVYSIAHRELTSELESERIETYAGASSEHQAFLKGLPMRYLRTHTPAQIDAHVRLEALRREAGVALAIERREGVYHLALLTKDRLSLFASVAGALSSFGLNILKAEAFANQQGTVLDTFVFEDPQRNLELNPPEVDRLKTTLERVILGKIAVKDLLKNRPRPLPPSRGGRVAPRVNVNNNASSNATLVEVVAQDRPGLLFDLANAFTDAHCSIDVVLVDTEAHKAIDVFYITREGVKLTDAAIADLQASLVRVCAG